MVKHTKKLKMWRGGIYFEVKSQGKKCFPGVTAGNRQGHGEKR